MSDDNIPIISKVNGVSTVLNTDMLKASVPDLLSEIERRGVNLPEVSFQLVQQMCALRNVRWNANNGGRTARNIGSPESGDVWAVFEDDSYMAVATFKREADALAFANPQFTTFERAAEIAGEVGELVNAVKKLRRHDMKMPGNYKPGEADRERLLRKAAYEIGDVFVTAFNLCVKLDIDSWQCIQVAFNTKSDEMGFPEKI